MFANLSSKLEQAVKSLSGQGRITELNIAQSMGQIRRALLEADVNYQVARTFANRVQEQALGERVLKSVKPGQLIVKIVYDELVHLLGGQAADLKFASRPPTVILVAGAAGFRQDHVLRQTSSPAQDRRARTHVGGGGCLPPGRGGSAQ